MIGFISPRLVITNTTGKALKILDIPIKPHAESVNLFDISPNLSESKVIDALRAPHGQLYVESQKTKDIILVECILTSFNGFTLNLNQLNINGEPSDNSIITFQDKSLAWTKKHEVSDIIDIIDKSFDAQPPLAKNNGQLFLPKANSFTNGYLSKEDWSLFRGKMNGIRIWQYQDFDRIVSGKVEITQFQNGESNGLFDHNFIINDSAVILNSKGDFPLSEASTLFSKKYVSVENHIGSTVVLNSIPKPNEKCRVWYLVSLPENTDVPSNYLPPPALVKQNRINILDKSDIGSTTTHIIYGVKKFLHSTLFNSKVGIGKDAESELDVNGKTSTIDFQLKNSPSLGYSLVSDTIGNANWQPNPYVSSGAPENFYNGQLWIKTPEYELFVYDGNRSKWIAINDYHVEAAKNSTHCGNVYLDSFDNIPMNFNTYVLPYDATLTALIASCQTESSWAAQIHCKNLLIPGCTLNVVNSDKAIATNLNVDFNKGDKIQLFVSGYGISMPRVEAIFKRRI